MNQCMQMIAEGVGNQDMNAFSALLDNDQLTSALASSASFPGFQELTLPAFPPTYKKKVVIGVVSIMNRRVSLMNMIIPLFNLSRTAMIML